MKATIKEVAKLAGVSPSTVSRVISDSPRISDETKEEVRKIMKTLGYHPNAIARSLVSRATKTIGIVMPQSTQEAFLNPFFPEALSGVSRAAHEEGYCILLSTGNDEKEQLESIKGIVMGGRVDGVIIMYSSVENVVLKAVSSLKIPVLIIGKPIDAKGVLYVDNDNVEAAHKVTQKLIEKGHKRIAFISGSLNYIVSLDRLDGYRDAIIENNMEFNREYIKQCEYSKESGARAMKELLNYKEKPTAVVLTDDVMAFGALEEAKKAGVRVPEQLEVVSFNNIPLAEFCTPGLTSVDINARSLGYEAARLMVEKIKGTAGEDRVIVPTKIVYRETLRE